LNKFRRGITTDPAGFINSSNPYQYVLNNPFFYVDPYGENLLGFLVGFLQFWERKKTKLEKVINQ
jgi:hypothetical protein